MDEQKQEQKQAEPVVVRKSAIVQIVTVVVVSVLAIAGLFFPIQVVDDVETKAVERGALLCASESGNCVESWNGSDLIVYSDGGSSQTLLLDGALGDIDSEGDIAVADWWNIGVQTAISMTAGSTITPTGTWQPLESGSAITSSATTAVVSGTTSGDLLILQNTNASDAIIIDGTGANVECKANVTLGAGDTLWLVWDATDWYCLSGYDNS